MRHLIFANTLSIVEFTPIQSNLHLLINKLLILVKNMLTPFVSCDSWT